MIVGIVGVGALLLGLLLGNDGFLGNKTASQAPHMQEHHMPPHPFGNHHFGKDPITCSIIFGFSKLDKTEQENVHLKNLRTAIMDNNSNINAEFSKVLNDVKDHGTTSQKTSATELIDKISEFRLRHHPDPHFGPHPSFHFGHHPGSHPGPHFNHHHGRHGLPPPHSTYWDKHKTINKIRDVLKYRITI